jgi:hypothetical protein
MPISTNYYLNAPSLSAATAIFTDAALTICAADGYYSDGTVVRQLSGCVLVTNVACPSCCIFSFESTESPQDDYGTACAQPVNQTYYYQPVDCIDNGIAIGDPVFYDTLGASSLPDGWFSTPTANPECNLSFLVSSGVIIQFINCCSQIEALCYDAESIEAVCCDCTES